jgi:hypothetical protein
MSGWIKLHRSMLEHWIANDAEYLKAWLIMLSEANFEDKSHLFNGALISVKRGQLIFGLESFSGKSKVGVSKLRTMLKLLEKDGMISRQKTSKYSTISIVNYDLYQDDDRQDAGKTQADDRQPATPKEGKNKRTKEVKSISDSLDFSAWPQQADPEILEAWLLMRKKVKASCSQISMNTIGKELEKAIAAGFNVDYCLSTAEASGWKGFKASWIKPEGATNGHQINTNLNRGERLQQWAADATQDFKRQLAELERQESLGIGNAGD